MNAKTLIAIASLVAAGHAAAADYTPFPVTTGAASTVSRAEVQAEARRAVAADEVVVGENAQVADEAVGRASRTDVRASTAQANRQGQLAVGELLSFEHRAVRASAV